MFNKHECFKKLIAVLDAESKAKYMEKLQLWWKFRATPSKSHFDAAVRDLIVNGEQLKAHNLFMLAIFEHNSRRQQQLHLQQQQQHQQQHHHQPSPVQPPAPAPQPAQASQLARTPAPQPPPPPALSTGGGGSNQMDITEYMEASPHAYSTPPHYVERCAANELFFPDAAFVAMRCDLHAWQHGFDGADKHVAELVASLCQAFVKNILTAMVANKESYKLRDGQFQYGFGTPMPNALLRNAHNIVDRTQESRVQLTEEGDSFQPAVRPSIDVVEQETAFAYATGVDAHSGGGTLTLRLLYDTLRTNPHIIGLHSIHSTNLLKLSLQLDE